VRHFKKWYTRNKQEIKGLKEELDESMDLFRITPLSKPKDINQIDRWNKRRQKLDYSIKKGINAVFKWKHDSDNMDNQSAIVKIGGSNSCNDVRYIFNLEVKNVKRGKMFLISVKKYGDRKRTLFGYATTVTEARKKCVDWVYEQFIMCEFGYIKGL